MSDRSCHRWSPALACVLEKHGYLFFDYDEEGWQVPGDAELLLVSPAAPDATERIDEAMSAAAPAIVEGPLPERLLGWLGVTASEPAPSTGVLQLADAAVRAASGRVTDETGGRLNAGVWRASDRDERMDWPELGVPIGAERARDWALPGWGVQRWSVDRRRCELLAWWIDEAGVRSPAIVRRDNVVGCCFGLFSFLAQSHTTPPARRAETNHWPRSIGVEALLLALIDGALAQAGLARARVMPWPAGTTWALSVRHDFDRHLDAEEVARVLDRHDAAGTSATWYWRAAHLGSERTYDRASAALRRVAEAEHHEVAHHTEQLWASDREEREALERGTGHAMLGSAAHGLRSCFRWQGAPNVMRAQELGYRYTEMLSLAHLVPHRFPQLEEDGRVRLRDVICLPHHESFDRGTQPGDTYREEIGPGLARFRRGGGLLQVLNHPDIHQDELFDWLSTVPREGRLDWTSAQVAEWWRRTHTAGQLRLRRGNAGFGVESASDVRGLVVEVRHPDGRLAYHRLDVAPSAPAQLDLDAEGAPSPTALGDPGEWREQPARRWMRDGAPALLGAEDSPATVSSNSTLLPERAALVAHLLEALAGDGRLSGARVLDAGCGLGALAGFLSARYAPELVIAIDTRADYIEAAARIARGQGLAGVEFRVEDLRSLAGVPDASLDVVLAVNSLGWAGGPADTAEAARAFARVLRPGGRILIQQASPWTLRDPLAKGPPLHLAPAGVARRISRATGWAQAHGRVRFIAPREMRRHLRRAGFEQLRVAGIRRGHLLRGPVTSLAAYYAVAGRRPL